VEIRLWLEAWRSSKLLLENRFPPRLVAADKKNNSLGFTEVRNRSIVGLLIGSARRTAK
jgi:hypothetical protein